jgi:transposase InsO family protein
VVVATETTAPQSPQPSSTPAPITHEMAAIAVVAAEVAIETAEVAIETAEVVVETVEVAVATTSTAAPPQPRPSTPRSGRPRFFPVPSAELEHRQRLRELLGHGWSAEPHPRDPSWQNQRRRLEQDIRNDAVTVVQELRNEGMSVAAAADMMGLSARSARRWQQDWDGAALRYRGRPQLRCTAARAEEVVWFLHRRGPLLGMPSLRAEFADVPGAELQDLLSCYRHLWLAAHPRLVHVLHWHRAGAVWAMDFTELSRPIDGLYRYVFAVRDLASGRQLAWRPVLDMTEATAQAELQLLFTIYGAPLVLKSDNGSAFRAEAMKRFLRRWRVWPLYSPPGAPWYNGAIEASIGSLTKRTQFEAERRGDDAWTSADLDAARALANDLSRPRGLHGPTPTQAWDARRAPTESDRDAFAVRVERLEESARVGDGIALDAELNHYDQAALHRGVLQQALVESGYLSFARRQLPQALFGKKTASFR